MWCDWNYSDRVRMTWKPNLQEMKLSAIYRWVLRDIYT